jgi:RNA polymerase sigma-70 factor (ECF subfamily)
MEEVSRDPSSSQAAPEGAAARSPASDPNEWVDQHGDALFSYALLRVRDRNVAEELVQETFLAAIQAADGFRGRSAERTWLMGILKHKLIDHLRRSSREQPMSAADGSDAALDSLFKRNGMWQTRPGDWEPDPSELLEQGEFWGVFRHCLGELPERVAAVFTLRVVDETEPDEVCKVLGITPTNLWVVLHRARARLRRCLELNWFAKATKDRS